MTQRASVFRLVDKVVRAYAVAALLSCGYASAAQTLSEIDEIDDDARRGHARNVVAQATATVLSSPAREQSDRALIALVAAQEALAMAAAPEPNDAHVQELLVAAAVAEAAATPLPKVYFVDEDEEPLG